MMQRIRCIFELFDFQNECNLHTLHKTGKMYEKSRFIVTRCGYSYEQKHPTKTNVLYISK